MFNTKIITGIMFAVCTLSPMVAMADAQSYANKKSGKVSFKSQDEKEEATTPVEASSAPTTNDVSAIEPAAGAADAPETAAPTETKSENSLAESMKLPRK